MIRPWPKLNSKKVGDYRIFSIRSELRQSPRTGEKHDFVIIDASSWVNVIAITPNQEMVLVEQYRHGTDSVELEIPGGVMDPEDVSPVATGCRELREETGFEGENAQIVASVSPNPAIMSNTCYTVLIENCRQTSKVEFDHAEDLCTRMVPMDQVPDLVAAGKIRHSLVVAALYQYELWKKMRS